MNGSVKTIGAFGLALATGIAGYAVAGWASEAPVNTVRVIKVDSKRYEFIPNELTVKKGETVDIELTTHDVVMGFAVPDITRERTNILPGQVAHVRFTVTKVGTFPFLCDVFCGSGHEEMDGTITVVE